MYRNNKPAGIINATEINASSAVKKHYQTKISPFFQLFDGAGSRTMRSCSDVL
jgi:hypothetical protein